MEKELRETVRDIIGSDFSYRELEEGLNTIYILETEGSQYVLKLHTNKEEGFSEGYKDDQKARFRAEARIYEMVNCETDVPSPEIVQTDFSQEKIPHHFYIMEKLDGKNFSSVKQDLGSQELSELLRQYGRYLAEIHNSIELESYGLIIDKKGIEYLEEADTWPRAFHKTLENTKDIIEERWEKPPQIDLEDLENTVNKLPRLPKPVLVHSDNRLENVLVDDGSIAGFLDWSFTRSGHAMYDLARAEYLLVDYDLGLSREEDDLDIYREALLEGYSEVRDIGDYRSQRAIYRFATVLWIMAGFPNWSSGWEKERKESFRERLLRWLEKERP